jgi:multiple sugar transport system permease protein
MTEGGPAKATQVLPITIYRIAFENLQLGRGAAAAMMLLAFLLALSVFFIRVLFRERRRGDEN